MKGSNVVNVISIDEERLKFRIHIGIIAGTNIVASTNPNKGTYKVALPIPTFFGNSNQYNQCLIKCNGFHASTDGAFADPAWSVSNPGAGVVNAFEKVTSLDIQLDIPSSQTTVITNGAFVAGGGVAGVNELGVSRVGGFRELMFLKVVSVGDANGNFDLASGRVACWEGHSDSEPILCGNPFGQTLTISHKEPLNDELCYLASVAGAGAAAGNDLGRYIYSFDVTMVPNK
tara:strand:+ start:71 stop:763 length:693 start_codon:yes stop_codon:yes gene_type:complete